MTVERMPRYFAMSRCPGGGGEARFQPSGWYVCDSEDLDDTNLARSIHGDEPCTNQDEARQLAHMINLEEGGYDRT